MESPFVGEWLIPGVAGRLFVLGTFIFAIFGAIAYFLAQQKDSLEWKRTARLFFGLHGVSIVGIIGILFLLIYNHRFEYQYVWQHSSLALPMNYLLSCFWEGQEGSFLLWIFWHMILGIVLIRLSGRWESSVMAVVLLTQAFLGSMLLGIYIGEYKIGSNPFMLLREVMAAPIFERSDYLSFIKDGNGLNPLLQNYWMTIHPPTLFLGFAATLIPFAYAIAGLWIRDYKGWVTAALPWMLFAGGILGTGILMGGAWAYEALSFGGFWAWDPVENASLVPWLTLVGGLHTMVIFRSTGHALRSSFLFCIGTFLLILYSTFLTRSGILGDTSVHSFTDLGMSGQLVFFMLFFVILALVLMAIRYPEIPQPKKEEEASSREFWMFVGSLIFLLSAAQIAFSTSIPVFNTILRGLSHLPVFGSLFKGELAPPTDVIDHYNRIQVWFAISMALLSAMVQYLVYKSAYWKDFFYRMAWMMLASVALSSLVAYFLQIHTPKYLILLISANFTIITNGWYMIKVLKAKLPVSGGSVTHIGFGLILLGILISNDKQEVISQNVAGIDFGEGFDEKSKGENVLLRRNIPIRMGDYLVTYQGDSLEEPNTFYRVTYENLKSKSKENPDRFTLYPYAQINPNMGGLIANPDTRHFWHKDIYTHVTSVPDKKKLEESRFKWDTLTVAIGDTFYTSRAFAIAERLMPQAQHADYSPKEGDLVIGLFIRLLTLEDQDFEAVPLMVINPDGRVQYYPASIPSLDIDFKLVKVLPEEKKLRIAFREPNADYDFIILKAIVFPFINLLWLGSVVMAIGFFMSIVRRREQRLRTLKK